MFKLNDALIKQILEGTLVGVHTNKTELLAAALNLLYHTGVVDGMTAAVTSSGEVPNLGPFDDLAKSSIPLKPIVFHDID